MEFTTAAKLALEAAPIGVVMVDERGTIVLVNAESERLFGYRREEMLGQPVEMLVPPRFRGAHPGLRAGFAASPSPRSMGAGRDLFAVRKDGSELPVEIGLNPIETDSGRFVLSVIVDITRRKTAEGELRALNATLEEQVARRTREIESRVMQQQRAAEALRREVAQRRQTEEELRAAMEAAEAASRAKSTFLANMSHEIRTPLSAVIGLTALVLEMELGSRQREYLSLVLESGESLLQVINDILDFSKIEAGRMGLVSAVFDHSEVVGDTMKSLALRAHSKQLELLVHLPLEMPAVLVGDPHRLRQVLVNLVGNAIKFTETGQVMLDVEVEARDRDRLRVHYAVSDTGSGIPAEKQEDIFNAFEQLDASTARRYGGTGLGLAISRRLVELMGGRIWVESEVGRGTTFHFTANFQVSEQAAPQSTAADTLRGVPVLVVDDSGVNRRILAEMLRGWGMSPAEAPGGEEALAVLESARSTDWPIGVMIVDSQMPGMDGFALAERVRHAPDLASTAIVMFSSGESPGDITRYDRLNIVAHLLKPVKPSELLGAIRLALDGASERPLQSVPSPLVQLPPLRILLAEDSVTNQRLASVALQRAGHEVEVAHNGREALEKLSAEKFDAVLMDVQMPEVDGLEATRTIRARERLTGEHIPIVALTAHAMQGDRQRCLAAGMDAYVSKPLRRAELLSAICEARRRSAASKGAAVPVGPQDSGDPAPPTGSPDDPVDWSLALETAFQDQRVLLDLATTFLAESPRLLAELRAACAQGDAVSAERAAHTLKGQFRLFGARAAAECARQIEIRVKGGDLDVGLLMRSLEAEGRNVRDALLRWTGTQWT